jgi:hypothetical protein
MQVPFRPLADSLYDNRFVAFVDILGFARKVQEDFDSVLDIYQQVLEASQIFDELPSGFGWDHGVSLRIYSDSFILTSPTLSPLVRIVKGLHIIALSHDCVIRGGIGFGKHVESSEGDNFYVVSQALVQAVEIEKHVKWPCVALHESIQIPTDLWNSGRGSYFRGLLYIDGIWIVNPFNIFWGRTAVARVSRLCEQYPGHREKYDWFLSLYDRFISGDTLPP